MNIFLEGNLKLPSLKVMRLAFDWIFDWKLKKLNIVPLLPKLDVLHYMLDLIASKLSDTSAKGLEAQ